MSRVRSIVAILFLFFFILTGAITFTILFRPLYAFDITYLDIEGMTGLSKEVLLHNYDQLMDYLTIPWNQQLVMDNFPSSANGLFHFYEVKVLFQLNFVLFVLTGIGSWFMIRQVIRKGELYLFKQYLVVAVIVPLVVLFFIAASFDRLFVLFHELFFNNDAWIFDWRTDPIILALPQSFFLHCFALVFFLLEGGLLGSFWLSKRKLAIQKAHS